ncbi:MAG TPA: IPExxxVDY family protein [Salinimicrobium sp.]|nr:IPExxxVDY family protein [Salinimicrobium sp.]
MLAHKLGLDDFADQPFKLIAIHCSVEEYKLAFLLNKHLDLRLVRVRKDIDFHFKSVEVLFALYKFSDELRYCDFYLISNKCQTKSQTMTEIGSLFEEEEMISNISFLLPEFQKADFFLKIVDEADSVKEQVLINKMKEIPQIATAYIIDSEQIKSKENLIFE